MQVERLADYENTDEENKNNESAEKTETDKNSENNNNNADNSETKTKSKKAINDDSMLDTISETKSRRKKAIKNKIRKRIREHRQRKYLEQYNSRFEENANLLKPQQEISEQATHTLIAEDSNGNPKTKHNESIKSKSKLSARNEYSRLYAKKDSQTTSKVNRTNADKVKIGLKQEKTISKLKVNKSDNKTTDLSLIESKLQQTERKFDNKWLKFKKKQQQKLIIKKQQLKNSRLAQYKATGKLIINAESENKSKSALGGKLIQ